MVKANLKEKLKKIESGELKPREYPNKKVVTSAKEAKRIAREWIKEDLIKEGILTTLDKIEPKAMTDEDKDYLRDLVGNAYENIKKVLHNYIDMNEEYYELISLWIIGTYLHDEFETFPYLFINAMKGSGKTRLLKLIAVLSKDGILNASMREAVLFRMGKKTLCIDEFEGIGSKEALALREILNCSYKKGMTISRMRKVRNALGEDYEIDEFEPYKPIVMANIWGMEEVLGDRCVTIILEKSSDERRTRLSEDFSDNYAIKAITAPLLKVLVQLCSLFGGNALKEWNNYINDRYNYTTTYTTYNTYNTQTTPFTHKNLENLENNGVPKEMGVNEKNKNKKFSVVSSVVNADSSVVSIEQINLLEVFNKIHDTGINGRNLELMMPFLMISNFISGTVFDKILNITKNITKERKETEMIESKDVMLIDFISRQELDVEFKTIKKMTIAFRLFIGNEEGEDKWINARWVGRALKRLSLIKEKRRVSQGIEIIPNVSKAIEKMRMFRQEKKE